MLKAGVSTACLYPMPVEDALYELLLGGVQNVEIFLNTHSELRKSFIMGLSELLKRFDVSCSSLHPFTCEIEPILLFSQYKRRTNDAIDYYKHYFAAMQALGAKVFVLHGNKVMGNNLLYFERFNMLSEIGSQFGITVAQENVARCTSRSLDFLKEMKAAIGDKAKFVLDVKQAVRSGENPFSIIEALANNIILVHMSDHGSYGDCLMIGNGNFKVKEFLNKLSILSPDCTVILELYRSAFENVSDLLQNYQVLNRMIENLTGDEKI